MEGTQLFAAIGREPTAHLVREFRLEVIEGPDQGTSFGPLVPPVRIGSARGNDLVLGDPTVSRFHCSIEAADGGVVLSDAGSTNGTFLGGERIRSAYLREEAQIRLGKSALVVRIVGEGRPMELSEAPSFGGLLGESSAMRALFALLARLARVEAAVLIEGETGSGKELVARALHSEGPRAQRSFVVVDCGAVAPSLVESELFGHTKGAFTGADAPRKGAFELADGGTIFLDEIGELPQALQPKLLRALETGTIKALGSAEEKTVSVRILAATHRNVRAMVNEGTFREDLYFRLAVCPIHVPPLRDRLDDVDILSRHFLAQALRAASPETPPPRLDLDTIAFLRAQPWPGNVRELRNSIERSVILGDPQEIERGHLATTLRRQVASERTGPIDPKVGLEESKRRFEREYLIRLLARNQGDITASAAEAEVHPKSLSRLLRRHGIRRDG